MIFLCNHSSLFSKIHCLHLLSLSFKVILIYIFSLSSGQLASCSFVIVHLLYHNSRSHHNISVTSPQLSNKINFCTWNFSGLRNHQSQKFSEPRNRRLISNRHFCNHSSRKSPVCFSHSPEVFSGGTYSILQSSSFQHWFKNWQEQRKHKLTASTFGGAVGFWPQRRVQLWLEKLGAIKPFSGNLATCWSNIKEEEALERYKLITGNTVLFPEFQVYGKRNPEDSWLAASPDGLVYGLHSRGVLEIKCPFFNGDKRIAFPWSRIPLHYIPQAQGLMEIMDRDWMDFYVWTLNGSSLFRINRDVEYWDVLKIALSDFWFKHVQPARDLCIERAITNPLIELQSLKPEPRHELCRDIVCGSKCIINNSKLLIREVHGKLLDWCIHSLILVC